MPAPAPAIERPEADGRDAARGERRRDRARFQRFGLLTPRVSPGIARARDVVLVAGVEDHLVIALGQIRDGALEPCGRHVTRLGETEDARRLGEPGLLQESPAAAAEAREKAGAKARAGRRIGPGGRIVRPGRAHEGHLEAACERHGYGEEQRVQVQVLVRVEMRHRQSGARGPRDLRFPLALHLGAADPAGEERGENMEPVRPEDGTREERRDVERRAHGHLAAGQAEVDAGLEEPHAAKVRDRCLERDAVREKARVREETSCAQRGDAARMCRREAEVVRIQDEPRQRFARRSARISGARRAISRRIVSTVRGEESVESPRVRGK
jgi:hypothetical protein